MSRQSTVFSPYEAATGQPWTIKFEYSPENRCASTVHYTQDDNIDICTIADSLMRTVQTRQTGVILDGGKNTKLCILSGRSVQDAFGRTVAACYPVAEDYGKILLSKLI